ncbi:hypothetical protein [Aerolutibacter ruishenii]|uniref:Signal transducing protein n=1 Tax=Aerolutibacter ruishenii TaxID=686800 RepID=A0A562LI80_9GAMM|nr:hypothetical protein [Lysobacter ruishenii]TWI07344.1 hypothetical protein IP93_02698 [Lysobacter ruishenii]
MRQVFSSARIENVEAVAQLLRDEGIEVRISDGRSYKGSRRGTFSYSDDNTRRPAVWVVQSEDQIRARDLLRKAGLLDSTRPGESSYLAPNFRSEEERYGKPSAQKRAWRIKAGLMLGIAVILGLAMVHSLRQVATPAPELASPPFDGRVAPTLDGIAMAVLNAEIPNTVMPVVCVSVDGRNPLPDVMRGIGSRDHLIVPANHCVRNADVDKGSIHGTSGQDAEILDVTAFRPSAPDAGTVEFSAYHHRMWARYKTFEVRHVDGQWKVVKTLRHVST